MFAELRGSDFQKIAGALFAAKVASAIFPD
jgi:hypothetical protein